MMHGIKHSRSQGLIDFAFMYAVEAHGTQVRKYTDEPYINHPIEVAQIVASVTDDCEMISAALLHDVIEDTPVTYEDLISAGFGRGIAMLVDELSDKSRPEDGNRAVRKGIDRDNLAKASARAHTIKLADLISNSKSIVEHDPRFAKTYMAEKKALLHVLVNGDADLHLRAVEIVCDYYLG